MSINYTKDQDNIVTLTVDQPGRPVNVINAAFGEALGEALAKLEKDAPLAGVIIRSGKSSFIVGAEIDMLQGMADPLAAFRMVEEMKAGMRRLETMGVPVAAAINGTALGGGLEIALACHYRVAVDHPKTKIGFPEVTLGLLPGGGGVTRLTRMLGLQAAFPFLIEGSQVDPAAAKAAGIIDELAADADEMLVKAKAWILANPDAKQPWDQPGFRIPGGDPRRPAVAQMVSVAPAMIRQKSRGNYPAPEAILAAMVDGAVVDFDTASRIESRYFTQLVTGKTAKNMIKAFWFQLNEINKGASRPKDVGPQETHKVGVLGAGMMGHGIAHASAFAGMEVVLKDVTLEAAEAGKAKVGKLFDYRVRGGKMGQEARDEAMGRILATADAADLKGCDLIIEAVFEDRGLKAKVTAEAEAQLEPDAVYASNTSTLPITGLAEASARPENFIGIHFFSPVHKMKLVEIIVGAKTSPTTLAKAFDFVLKIRKTPIVVNDSRGFYTSRVFSTYTSEGMALLAEGQHPRTIESAGLAAGMPVGPLAITDEINMGLALHIREQTRKDYEAEGKEFARQPADDILDQMVTEQKRPGKAQGAGFYEYPEGGKKFLWPGLAELFPDQGVQLDQKQMIERLMFAQALEAARCRGENVVTSTADANIGSIFGWGFAPFKGGTLQYINDYGLADFVSRSRTLARLYGERFEPPQLLVEMAGRGEEF